MKGKVLTLFVFVLFLVPGSAMAQSQAKAPPLDTSLKQFIGKMTPLTDRRLGPLDDRVVVVTFFASWCPPCRPEFGHLNEVRRTFAAQDVTILAINLFEDFFEKGKARRMTRFLDAIKPAFAVLRAADDRQVEIKFGGVDRIPTVYVFDRRGKPAFTFIHQVDATKTHATSTELTQVLRNILGR